MKISIQALPGQLAKRSTEVLEKLNGANDAGLRAAARVLRGGIREALHQPGSGELYRSRKDRAARALEAEHDRLTAKLAREDLRKRERSAAKQKLAGVARRLKRTVRGQTQDETLRRMGLDGGTHRAIHQASAAGEAPAPDVGLLPQAVVVGKAEGELRVGVGGKWRGWFALNDGRGRIRAARPFMALGLARVRDKLSKAFVDIARKAIGGGTT